MSEHNDSGMNTDNETEPHGQAALVSRRAVLETGGMLLGGFAVPSILGDRALAAGETSAQAPGSTSLIRLASVSTIQDGGLLQALLLPFERQTGHHVQVHVGDDVYVQARAGRADVVLSHFGHKDAQAFVQEGLGQWPRTVLFNSIALIIPTNDPAYVAHLSDPVDVSC
jgi:ABC-type tungstate transport system permease subunit